MHIDDICNAILHVIDKKLTGCYNLTANNSTAISDLITNQNSINFISNNYVNYDSDNSDLVATGWKQKIDVKSWFIKQHENNNGFKKSYDQNHRVQYYYFFQIYLKNIPLHS